MTNSELEKENRENPFFVSYNTPHDTVPFNRIKTSDYEEAFMEGIRRDNEEIDKIVAGSIKQRKAQELLYDNAVINR